MRPGAENGDFGSHTCLSSYSRRWISVDVASDVPQKIIEHPRQRPQLTTTVLRREAFQPLSARTLKSPNYAAASATVATEAVRSATHHHRCRQHCQCSAGGRDCGTTLATQRSTGGRDCGTTLATQRSTGRAASRRGHTGRPPQVSSAHPTVLYFYLHMSHGPACPYVLLLTRPPPDGTPLAHLPAELAPWYRSQSM